MKFIYNGIVYNAIFDVEHPFSHVRLSTDWWIEDTKYKGISIPIKSGKLFYA